MDFSSICRTCLDNKVSLNPIFVSENNVNIFSNTIFLCTGVQINYKDGLPQNMCVTCMSKFNNSLKFRKQCQQAERKLLSIKNKIVTVNSHNNTIVANEKHCLKLMSEPRATLKQQLLETHNSFNDTEIKTEYKNGIKCEIEGDGSDDEPLKFFIGQNIQSNDLKNLNNAKIESPDDRISQNPDYFVDTTVFNNKNQLKTERILEQINNAYENGTEAKPFECVVLSQKPQNKKLINLNITENLQSDNEEQCIEDLTEDLNAEPIYKENTDLKVTEDNKSEIDVPYNIVIDSVNQKAMRVVCKLCQKELSIRSIDTHMDRKHPGADGRKVKCELCDSFVTKEKMKRHKNLMHGRIGAKCGYCKSEFNSKEMLQDHVPTCPAKTKKRKPYDSGRKLAECNICGMTMQRASLKKHIAVKHAGMRPVCEHCGKSFGNKFRLKEHYRAKHGYEKIQCSFCDFRSAGTMAMRNHERRHRGEKPYVCETCGAKFHAGYLLIQHKHSHKTEKLVKCDLCPASFKANNNLHMHKLTCHSKSFYRCALCSRTYKCRYYALKHVRLTHNVSDPAAVIKLISQ